MAEFTDLAGLAACPCCGLIQTLDGVPAGYRARCGRCHTRLRGAAGRLRRRHVTAALALAALFIYPVVFGYTSRNRLTTKGMPGGRILHSTSTDIKMMPNA